MHTFNICHTFAITEKNKTTLNKHNAMKKYFVNGKQITESEAKAIEKRNQEYMNSGDFSLIAKCEFIVIIKKEEL